MTNRYSKMELAAFLVSSEHAGLEREEVLHLGGAGGRIGQDSVRHRIRKGEGTYQAFEGISRSDGNVQQHAA